MQSVNQSSTQNDPTRPTHLGVGSDLRLYAGIFSLLPAGFFWYMFSYYLGEPEFTNGFRAWIFIFSFIHSVAAIGSTILASLPYTRRLITEYKTSPERILVSLTR